ncbi:Calx-beta domain-containing protein [Kribbella sp. NPDC050241]|uniref:Calx-beta domain-containing protein n=1 Tax=Kribbella sp. NPDC050241 TaxID=3364115 RepID=UPI0037997784
MRRKRTGSVVAALAALALVSGSAVVAEAAPAAAVGTAYYVDAARGNDTKGNGSAQKPWKTISKAAAQAGAGDTVKIRSGTYRETVRPKNSGTSGRPITFEPDNGAKVTVSGADLLTGSWSATHDSIYRSPASLPMGDFLDQVYVDGVANNLARSPNTPVGNLYDPNLWDRDAAGSTGSLLHDPVNLNQPAGTWDGAALFVEDAGAWNFSSVLVKNSTPGDLHLDRSQDKYQVKLSTYDDTVTLYGPGGVLGSDSMPISPDTTYHVEVSAIGGNIVVSVDGDKVISVSGATIAEGTFGFAVESDSADVPARADFTNVDAEILSTNPAHEPTGLVAPTFASNINGWVKGEETGWWESDGTSMHGFTQPQSKGTIAQYETGKPAKDFVYSADLKPTTEGVVSLSFRKELSKGYVIDLADWGLGGSEYFIMGKLAALDYPGEWFYDKTAGQLYLRTTGSDSPKRHRIEYKARDLAFDLTERSNMLVKGINLFAATIDTARGSDNVIDGIDAKYPNDYNLQWGAGRGGGICVCGTRDTLKNSEIAYASGSLVTVGGQHNKLVNNLIHDGTYGGIVFNSAIEVTGLGHLISNNTVYNSGRSLIGGEFHSSIIQYNDFSKGDYFAHDTGLLYVAHNDLGHSEIHHNYFHDNAHRSNGEGDYTCGIYLDESSANALVYDNVTWNISWQGIVVNRLSNFVQVYNNTTYNHSGIQVSEPTYGLDAYGDRIVNNIVVDGIGTGASNIGAVFSNNLDQGDPGFADPAAHDFQLAPGSPARDRGTPIRGITDGFTGSAPDIGAFEAGGATWTAGHDPTDPPDPQFGFLDTDYTDLMVNGSLDLNRIGQPTINSLFGWTRTHDKTAQPTYDHADGAVTARYHFKTGIALGTGEDGIEQTVTGLTPNTTYRIRGFLRANSDGQTVRLGVKDYGGPEVYEEQSATSWTDKTITFATGPNSTSATIYGYKPTTGGYAWVDDIYMYAPPMSLDISDAAVPEGNSGTSTATVRVTLTPASAGPVTVHYATADDTAVAGQDYLSASGTLTFAPGETTKDIPVTITGDTTDEPDERFFVNLSNATGGAAIHDGSAFVTVSNDEPPPDGVVRVNDHTTGTGLNQFEFVGGWGVNTNPSAYQNDVTFSNVSGDYYQVRFSGTQVKLYSELGSVMGIVGVTVDGGAETLVDNYSATSAGQVLRYTSPVLPAGDHLLKVRITGTKNDNAAGTWSVADRVDITT